MQSLQTPPANAFSGFCLLHTISHQVFHGSGVHRFRFPQFSDGWSVGERGCWHLCAIDVCIHWTGKLYRSDLFEMIC